MADRNFYRFRSEWPLAASTDVVYLALSELADYPAWWPEVRSAVRIDDEAYRLTCRSSLPYDLDFVTRQNRMDANAGLLEANMTGDLEGFSRWTITSAGSGTTAVFEEEVTANKSLLRKLALVARPAFKVNHALMMKHGRRGLSTYLAGVRLGRATAAELRPN
jgi:hypothetical protein